ncbi:hypothetical protein [Lentzea sp. NBRC 105346]|uniref:hypothetical protein n=1 Tax=Lentzea sp. NBRC 105346 TaxID=3032205 RepID=UPI0025534146|nr:hypothetical protein [Lentzea sp. NBRC 105346]
MTRWLLSRRRELVVPYRDVRGRRTIAVVRKSMGFVRLDGDGFGPIYLSASRVDQLRAALRTAVFDLDRLDERDAGPGLVVDIPAQRTGEARPGKVDHPAG